MKIKLLYIDDLSLAESGRQMLDPTPIDILNAITSMKTSAVRMIILSTVDNFDVVFDNDWCGIGKAVNEDLYYFDHYFNGEDYLLYNPNFDDSPEIAVLYGQQVHQRPSSCVNIEDAIKLATYYLNNCKKCPLTLRGHRTTGEPLISNK